MYKHFRHLFFFSFFFLNWLVALIHNFPGHEDSAACVILLVLTLLCVMKKAVTLPLPPKPALASPMPVLVSCERGREGRGGNAVWLGKD